MGIKVRGNNTRRYAGLQAKIRRPASRFIGIDQFRQIVEDADFAQTYRAIFPHKLSLQDFHGPAFPKSANQIFASKAPKQPTNAYKEILWTLSRCLQFAPQLKQFSDYRELYEKAVLLNDYSAAINLLNLIEQEFGKSIWLYQNRIASAHISQSESAPSEAATLILDEVKNNSILHPLMHYIRRRMESATPRDKLKTEISSQIKSELYSSYFRSKVLNTTDSSEAAVRSLLFIDAQASIIDHYMSLVLVLQAATSDQMLTDEMIAWILPTLCRLFDTTQDRRLLGVLNVYGKYLDLPYDTCSERASAIEAYTDGDYQKCELHALNVLSVDPLDSAIRLLHVKAQVAMDKPRLNTLSLCGEIHSHIHNILSANKEFYPSVHALIVLGDRFIDHHWMLYIKAAILYEIGAEERGRTPRWMRDVFVREYYMSPFCALTLGTDKATAALDAFNVSGKYPKTIQLVKNIIECKTENIAVITSQQAKYIARELLAQKQFKEAVEYYKVAATNESRGAARLRSLGGQSLALMLDKQYKNAFNIVVDAFLDNPHAPLLLPLDELVAQLPEADQWPNTISLGIALSLASQYVSDGDLSKLRLAFEKFSEENGIATPTALVERVDEFGLQKVIAYLEYVWQPEVMRQTLIYMTPEQIEEARIEACQVLAKIDPDRVRAHKDELASRIKQQEISKATALVEQSKVYVDIEAIKRALKSKLKTSYSQYKNSLSQHVKPQSEFLNKIQFAFEGFDSASSLPTLLSHVHITEGLEPLTQADIQFSGLFGEITKEFLTGDHGLNAYLSTRVRHGKFIDALRKSVTSEHLVTARHDDGTYVPNDYWIKALAGSSCINEIISALEVFAVNFDKTLTYVRDHKIQIRTFYDLKPIDEYSNGLFQYHFSYLERKLMQSYDADFKDFDELIVKCVDSLWEKTDTNLVSVRQYMTETLKSELMKLFDSLSEEITKIYRNSIPSQLSNAVARSRTATQQALDNVVTWFKRSEVYDRQDFEIDFPGQIAANMVHRTLSTPSGWGGPIYQTDADSKLSGRTLDALVDIFYALYENAVKYAELESILLKIETVMSVKNGEFKATVTSNALPPTQSQLATLNDLRASLSTQESRRLAQYEGRSGFRKILLALSSPIYKTSFLEFEHSDNEKFIVNFGFKISESI